MAEKCVFCKWTRDSSAANTRFFSIPTEPGIKKMRWLVSIGNREMRKRDKVCSIHFRQGRPSNDSSHEDFVPHLFLNSRGPPAPEVLNYLEESLSFPSDSANNKPPTMSQQDSSLMSPSRRCPNIIRRVAGNQNPLYQTIAHPASGAGSSSNQMEICADGSYATVKEEKPDSRIRPHDNQHDSNDMEPVVKRMRIIQSSPRTDSMPRTHRLGEPVILKQRIIIQRYEGVGSDNSKNGYSTISGSR